MAAFRLDVRSHLDTFSFSGDVATLEKFVLDVYDDNAECLLETKSSHQLSISYRLGTDVVFRAGEAYASMTVYDFFEGIRRCLTERPDAKFRGVGLIDKFVRNHDEEVRTKTATLALGDGCQKSSPCVVELSIGRSDKRKAKAVPNETADERAVEKAADGKADGKTVGKPKRYSTRETNRALYFATLKAKR